MNLNKKQLSSLKRLISEKIKEDVEISNIVKIGEGCHGSAFKVSLNNNQNIILKYFNNYGRNLKEYENRIKEAFQFQRTSSLIPNHVRIFDIVHLNEEKFEKYEKNEPIILMEEVIGDEYFSDLLNILKHGASKKDFERVEIISNYLINLHSNVGENETYQLYLKDLYSNGILELTNELRNNFSDIEIFEIKKRFLELEEQLSKEQKRCRKIHGEYFPGTIHFNIENNKKQTYDMRRFGFGEVCDDFGSMLINYFIFPIQINGEIKKEFIDIANKFYKSYTQKSSDNKIDNYLHYFMGYRLLILVNPNIVPMKEENRKKIKKILFKLLQFEKYKHNEFSSYILKNFSNNANS